MLGTLGAGYLLGWLWPELHNSGPQLLIWGFCISTVLVYQFTFAVNSLGHRVGTRRFETNDASHNNWWLALAMLGEGWHINHHKFPSGARSGFRLWSWIRPGWYSGRFGGSAGTRPAACAAHDPGREPAPHGGPGVSLAGAGSPGRCR